MIFYWDIRTLSYAYIFFNIFHFFHVFFYLGAVSFVLMMFSFQADQVNEKCSSLETEVNSKGEQSQSLQAELDALKEDHKV